MMWMCTKVSDANRELFKKIWSEVSNLFCLETTGKMFYLFAYSKV